MVKQEGMVGIKILGIHYFLHHLQQMLFLICVPNNQEDTFHEPAKADNVRLASFFSLLQTNMTSIQSHELSRNGDKEKII